jgi:uncharacterized protein with PIN domain
MTSISRKLRRNKLKKAQKEVEATLGLFEKIADKCLTCEAKFDKTNKEHVSSWSVVVRKEEEKVNLYCPECWNGAKDFIKQLKEQLDETDV